MRIKALREAHDLTQDDLGKALGISGAAVAQWETGKTKPGYRSLHKMEERYGWTAKWLETGRGPQLKAPAEASLRPLSPWDDSTPLDDDEVEIPLFREVEMAAGSGSTHAVEINGRKLRFSRATMRSAGVEVANAACATVTGNSMERLILDGATIGIDRGRTQIVDGEIYAIDHDGMLRVKYLYRLPGGGIRLRSENSEEHPDENLTAEQAAKVRILGWVFWWSTVRKWRGK